MSEKWKFGTIVESRSLSERLIAMVVFDDGKDRGLYCEVQLITLGGDLPDKDKYYEYGKVWTWSMTRSWWAVVDEP